METYCQILLLLVKLQKVYPQIPVIIQKQVSDMMKSQQNRSKRNMGDMGEFLVKLALSKYGLTNTKINDVLIREYSARQVMWVMKEHPDVEYKYNERAKNFFKSSLVSHQLFAFNIEAAKTFINPEMVQKLEQNCGFPDDNTMSDFLKRIDWVKANVTNFKCFFNCIGLGEHINADNEKEMHEYLDRAIMVSRKQRYTRY